MKKTVNFCLSAGLVLAIALIAPASAKTQPLQDGLTRTDATLLAASPEFGNVIKHEAQERRQEWKDGQKARQKDFKEDLKQRHEDMKDKRKGKEKKYGEDKGKRRGEWQDGKKGDGRSNFHSPEERHGGNMRPGEGRDFKGQGHEPMGEKPHPEKNNFGHRP